MPHSQDVIAISKMTPSTAPITNEAEKDFYWKTILKLWKLPPHLKHFPGANPVSLERRNLDELQCEDYIVALKTDGVRQLLLLTLRMCSKEPISIMVDRALNMYEVEVWANDSYFTANSIFDGELVWRNQEHFQYVVFDAICIKGNSCLSTCYRKRLSAIHGCILCVNSSHSDELIEQMIQEEDKLTCRNNEPAIEMCPKRCVKKAQIHELWEQRVLCDHQNDGMIFTKNIGGVETGTASSIFKWKQTHSIDVRAIYDAKKWKFWANSNDSCGEVDITHTIHDFVLRFSINSLLGALEDFQTTIVECNLSLRDDGHFDVTPVRQRSDKVTANSMKTILATLQNTMENMHIDEIIEGMNEKKNHSSVCFKDTSKRKLT